jgi:hypothetical protein
MPPIPQRRVKVGFTGTQIGLTYFQSIKLLELLQKVYGESFSHGDCQGADFHAHMIAMECKYKTIIHPPLSDSKRAFCYGHTMLPPKEYLDRNKDIVDSTDFLVACPREKEEQLRSGTWSTVRYAVKRNKTVQIIYPDGEIEIRT